MDRFEAAQAIRDGKVVKVTTGPGEDHPVLLAWLDVGVVMSEAIGGWSAGVREPVCFIGAEYLEGEFLAKNRALEVFDGEPPGGRERGPH